MATELFSETVTVHAPDGVADGFFARPANGGPHPAVLVYTDAFGIRGAVEAHARRLASTATASSCRTSSTGTASRR